MATGLALNVMQTMALMGMMTALWQKGSMSLARELVEEILVLIGFNKKLTNLERTCLILAKGFTWTGTVALLLIYLGKGTSKEKSWSCTRF